MLKANNYDLESGEQSIFDVELNRASPAWLSAVAELPKLQPEIQARFR